MNSEYESKSNAKKKNQQNKSHRTEPHNENWNKPISIESS